MSHLPLRALGITLALALAASGLIMSPATAAHADGRVVSKKDVDGDKRKDVVRYKSDGKYATVTVDRARGKTLRKRLKTAYVNGGIWHGAAAINGRRGAELVVVTYGGAHTLFSTVLTYYKGKLRVHKTPGHASRWVFDSAYSVAVGWRRFKEDDKVFITKRSVSRSYPSNKWSGRAITYRWSKNAWHKHGKAKKLRPATDKKAYKYGGWRVHGLSVWPG